ncbi:MAG: [FeFe] hydrogenase H-cluster radical SAM maturase HydE [Candidatus Omnitrophota bacterium]
MCYAIPGKVEKIEGRTVVVDYFGEKRKAFNELADLSAGDYIYAQGGFVISKISDSEAESILHVWKEEFFNLQEVDLRISRMSLEQDSMDNKLTGILDRALESRPLKKEELLYLLNLQDEPRVGLFLKTANFLRQKFHKNSCCVHGIIEISNYCKRNCLYCGISSQNKNLKRYRMNRQEILDAAREAIEDYGFKALVLQSGEDAGYDIKELADIIREIKDKWPALIFISFGEIGLDNLKVLYEAGARGLLMRFETSNPQKYSQLHPGQSLESRLEHLKKAYEIGYLILTGGLIGLPGQTKEDIMNDIFLAKELHAEMFSFGPFLPHPDTALAGNKPINPEEVMKVLALSRLVDSENAKILVTTALETLDSQSRKKALLSGANSVMLNVTPMKYRQLYSIYPNRAHSSESIENQINETISLLRSLGRAPTDLSI